MAVTTAEQEQQERELLDYLSVVSTFPPRAIHTEAQLDRAIEVMDLLLEKGSSMTIAERLYLDTLSTLVEAYEREHDPFPTVSGVEVLRHLMETNGLRQADLLDVFPTRSVVSEVLSGSRNLTLDHMRNLSKRFGLPLDTFAA